MSANAGPAPTLRSTVSAGSVPAVPPGPGSPAAAPDGIVERLGPDLRGLRFVAAAAGVLLTLAGFALAGLLPGPAKEFPPAWQDLLTGLGVPEQTGLQIGPWLVPLAVALATALVATAAALALPVRSVSRTVALRPVHGHRPRDTAADHTSAARTAAELETLLSLPGTRIFHGLRIPGTPDVHVDHAVLNGGRLVLIESVVWPPGEYRWVNEREVGQTSSRRPNVRPVRVADLPGNRTASTLCRELRVQIAVWPESAGTVEFAPGEEVSPGGVQAGDVAGSVARIRAWLAAGELAGHVDRAVVARLRRLLR